MAPGRFGDVRGVDEVDMWCRVVFETERVDGPRRAEGDRDWEC